jgi:hypothetical protein
MKTKYCISVICLGIAIYCFTGCIPVGFSNTNWEIHKQIEPLNLKPVLSLDLGPFAMAIIRNAAANADENDEAVEYLKEIRKIRIGIYETADSEPEQPDVDLDIVVQGLKTSRWQLFLKARDKNERVVMFYRLKKDRLDSLAVIALSGHELVAVELAGNLERIVEKAIRDQGIDIEDLVNTHI